MRSLLTAFLLVFTSGVNASLVFTSPGMVTLTAEDGSGDNQLIIDPAGPFWAGQVLSAMDDAAAYSDGLLVPFGASVISQVDGFGQDISAEVVAEFIQFDLLAPAEVTLSVDIDYSQFDFGNGEGGIEGFAAIGGPGNSVFYEFELDPDPLAPLPVFEQTLIFGPGSYGFASGLFAYAAGDPQAYFDVQTFTAFSVSFQAVPVPAAIWLFATALLAATGLAKRPGQARIHKRG